MNRPYDPNDPNDPANWQHSDYYGNLDVPPTANTQTLQGYQEYPPQYSPHHQSLPLQSSFMAHHQSTDLQQGYQHFDTSGFTGVAGLTGQAMSTAYGAGGDPSYFQDAHSFETGVLPRFPQDQAFHPDNTFSPFLPLQTQGYDGSCHPQSYEFQSPQAPQLSGFGAVATETTPVSEQAYQHKGPENQDGEARDQERERDHVCCDTCMAYQRSNRRNMCQFTTDIHRKTPCTSCSTNGRACVVSQIGQREMARLFKEGEKDSLTRNPVWLVDHAMRSKCQVFLPASYDGECKPTSAKCQAAFNLKR